MKKEQEKNVELWEVVVDNEWIYEGPYEKAEECAMGYWSDPDFWGDCELISEGEFYGYIYQVVDDGYAYN